MSSTSISSTDNNLEANLSPNRRAATQGKGEFSMEFSHYERAPGQLQKELISKYLKAQAERNKK